LAASRAGTLFGRTNDHSLYARQAIGQFLPSRMLAFLWLFLRGRRQSFALALRLDFGVAHSRLQLQQRARQIIWS